MLKSIRRVSNHKIENHYRETETITMVVPHQAIPLQEIRPFDIWFLLGLGVLVEVVSRYLSFTTKSKSSRERALDEDLVRLNFETAQKRRLGPSAFVETSKLERQVLAKEKELEKMISTRKANTERVAKLVKNGSLAIYTVVAIAYYSLPIFKIDGMKIDGDLSLIDEDRALGFLQGFLFPISYVGIGMKISRYGLHKAGIGALVVLWSSQVTVGKIIDGIEALLLV
jgi:hypothetical protein